MEISSKQGPDFRSIPSSELSAASHGWLLGCKGQGMKSEEVHRQAYLHTLYLKAQGFAQRGSTLREKGQQRVCIDLGDALQPFQ